MSKGYVQISLFRLAKSDNDVGSPFEAVDSGDQHQLAEIIVPHTRVDIGAK